MNAVTAFVQPTTSLAAPPPRMPGNAVGEFNITAAGGFDVTPVDPGVKRWKFAVVSIRKDDFGGSLHVPVATADGYQVRNLFLAYLIRLAYVPQTGGADLYFTDQ